MRAKMKINSVLSFGTGETLKLSAVAKNGYDSEGNDENNTYAKFTPSASLEITIMNPNLLGKFKVGEEYYLDFTPAQ